MAISEHPYGTGNGHAAAAPFAPPHNLEAEQSVLGTVLLSDTALPALIIDERIQPEDFYRESHGRIFRAMLDLHTKGEPIDAVTLKELLKQAAGLAGVGGGGGGGLPAGARPRLPGGRPPAHRTLPPHPAHRPRDGAAGARAASPLRGPAARPRPRRAAAGGGGPRGAVAPRGRPRRPPQGLPADRGPPRRRAREAPRALARGHGAHGDAVGLRRPRHDHGRLPARKPHHPRRAPVHGEERPDGQLRRERGAPARQGGGALLAGDVRGRARAA